MTATAITILLLAKPVPRYAILGIPLILLGETIRLWAAGYLTKYSELVTSGPYALCRNPLYLGSFLILAGYLAMFGRLEILVIGIMMFWVLHGGAIAYEENELKRKFGTQYTEYAKKVPRLIPKIGHLKGNGDFSWERVITNNEHKTAIMNLIFCALMVINAFTARMSPIAWFAAAFHR
ncbi:MAG: methyltransferase family protein [Armatimonadota bacterium]